MKVFAELPHDLAKGIEGAQLQMRARDFYNAAEAIASYLGQDTLADQIGIEFNALSDEERQALKTNGLGKYGGFDLVSKPEVKISLCLVAREISPSFKLLDHYIEALKDPAQIEKITKRFPAMTAERITTILSR